MSRQDVPAPSAVERAEALMTNWERRLSPARPQPAPKPAARPAKTDPAAKRAEAMVNRAGQQAGGRGLIRVAAWGYVWLAARLQAVADPIQRTWQESVEEAQREQEQQAARQGGPGAGHREAREEKQGEGKLKKTVGATAEVANTATDAAGA